MGSAAAWQLARRGAKVVGIDRWAPPHDRGSSHGDTRITRQAIGEGDHYVPLVLRAYELFREIEALTGERLLVETGGLWISSDRRKSEVHGTRFFANTVAAAKRFGIAHELLDAREIRKRFPQFAVADGERGYYEPAAGYLRPEACVAAQLALARSKGAEIRTGERVLSIREAGSRAVVTTDRGRHEADQVILSAGARVRPFLPREVAARLTVTRQQLHWYAAEGPIARFEAPAFPVFIWELSDRDRVIYGFPAVGGAAGGVKVATERYDQVLTDAALEESGGPAPATPEEARAMHRELVAGHIPGLTERPVKSASCLYTATPDFGFLIERLTATPHVILASPCSGHGFKHSAAIGEMLAQMALGETPTIRL